MIVLSRKSIADISKGELPKSKPSGARPPTSPMQTWPLPESRSVSASSTVPTITIFDAPFAKATAAVVKARKTSMIATVPVARVAPFEKAEDRDFNRDGP
jgi:hypothetical protein